MKNSKKIQHCLAFLMLFLVASFSFADSSLIQVAPQTPDLNQTHRDLIYYHNSGQYEKDIEKVAAQAKIELDRLLTEKVGTETKSSTKKKSAVTKSTDTKSDNHSLAIIFDIDETVLSNWPVMEKNDFSGSMTIFNAWVNEGKAEPIKPMLKLYQHAQKQGVTIFFITGRDESTRKATERNLKTTGFTGYKTLYMRPIDPSKRKDAAEYKTNLRQSIEKEGYEIIMSVGDQYSDLCGSHVKSLVKLPNPFYFIPGCSIKTLCDWKPKDLYHADDWDKVCPVLYTN